MIKWLLARNVPRWIVYALNGFATLFAWSMYTAILIAVLFWPGIAALALGYTDSAAAIGSIAWWVIAIIGMFVFAHSAESIDKQFPPRKTKEDDEVK